MADKGVETKPSSTAMMAALRRALAHLEYGGEPFGPDSLAVHFLPSHYCFFLKFRRVRANTRTRLSKSFPGMAEYLIARTAHFDRLFKEALTGQTPQIVLLGAGYDSRAFRFAGLNRGGKVGNDRGSDHGRSPVSPRRLPEAPGRIARRPAERVAATLRNEAIPCPSQISPWKARSPL